MKQILKIIIIQLIAFPFILCSQEISTRIKSDFQEDSTNLKIINTAITEDSVLNLIFVLPVESQNHYKYGNGIDECKELIKNNKISNNVIFIQPDYCRTPWYGNNPKDSSIWQLEYTIEIIEKVQLQYNNKKHKIYLLGFSKSGSGSMNILLKYPGLIDGVMIWDAPLSTKWNEKWEMNFSFGTEVNFMKNYYLMREYGIDFENIKSKLIIIGGYDLFEIQIKEFLKRLDNNGVNYIYDDTLKYTHEWNKDWIYKLLLYAGTLTK